MIKAVIFDLDGTLVNSLYDLCDSVNFALEKYNFPTHPLSAYNDFVGNGMSKLIERALPGGATPENFNDVYTAFIDRYAETYLNKTRPYDGIKESVDALYNAGIKIAVLSNKKSEFTEKIIKTFFGDSFSLIVGKSDRYPLKPDITSTLAIMKEFSVTPDECAFVGDSNVDMTVAVNSGCIPVGVLWGFRTEEELLKSGAKYILKNPNDTAPFIINFKDEK